MHCDNSTTVVKHGAFEVWTTQSCKWKFNSACVYTHVMCNGGVIEIYKEFVCV